MEGFEAWRGVRRLLCVRLDGMGDVIMTSPALRALKESLPGVRLTLLASSAGAQAGRLIPEVDDVLAYDPPWMKATGERGENRGDRAVIEGLRRRRFDAAVIFTVYSQSPLPAALLCFLAGVPRRLAHCRENPYALLTHWVRETEPERGVRHEVQRQLDLVAAVQCRPSDTRLRLSVDDAARRGLAEAFLRAGRASREEYLVVHPGATAPSRRYPPERFAEVLSGLRGRSRLGIVLSGSASERPLADKVRRLSGAPALNLAGRLSLAELAALLQGARLVISNNTSAAHIAAAVGTPVVDLYALTNPQHTPWRVPSRVLFHDVPCRYCYRSVCPEGHHDCLEKVRPQEVVAAALELLKPPVPRAYS